MAPIGQCSSRESGSLARREAQLHTPQQCHLGRWCLHRSPALGKQLDLRWVSSVTSGRAAPSSSLLVVIKVRPEALGILVAVVALVQGDSVSRF